MAEAGAGGGTTSDLSDAIVETSSSVVVQPPSGGYGDDHTSNDNIPQTGIVIDSFSDSFMIKYRTRFLEAIEELKMKRDQSDEREQKMHELISIKHKLEQDMEEQQAKLSEAFEKHRLQDVDIQRRCNEKIRSIEEEKAKLLCANDSKDKEFQALKDEIRALHMIRYTLEKKIGEQEHNIQVLNSSRESFHSQLGQIEQLYADIDKQATEVTEQIDTLESNVKETVLLNKKLQYVTNHQNCLINDFEKDLKDCHKTMTELKAKSNSSMEVAVNPERYAIQELKYQKELVHQVEMQLSMLQDEHYFVLQSLKEAHALIDKHAENSNKNDRIEAELKEEVSALKDEVDSLQNQLLLKSDELVAFQKDMEVKLNSSEEKANDLSKRLKNLQEDYSALQKSHEQLEESHKSLQCDKEAAINKTEAKLSVMKEELDECQQVIQSVNKDKAELEAQLASTIEEHATKIAQDKATQTETTTASMIFHDNDKIKSALSPEILPSASSQESPSLALKTTPVKRVTEFENDHLVTPQSKKCRSIDDVSEMCSSIVEDILHKVTFIDDLNNPYSDICHDSDVIAVPPSVDGKSHDVFSFQVDDLMDTQFSDQINQIETFLKKDRLKLTRVTNK